MIPGPLSERAIVLAPTGRDSAVAVQILREAGLPAQIVVDLPALVVELEKGAGFAVIADEAVQTSDLRAFVDYLHGQPAWSDFPIVLLTHHGGGPERNPAAARVAELLGNVTFLERPFHPTTLASVARTAVRSRRRQYEARARLAELADLTQTLEERVAERTHDLFEEVAARERAQDQLRQAQKLESIGKLTGGVAHDFNNLLAAVMGNLELLRKRTDLDDERAQRYIRGAFQGAERGAALTQRLLAFARQQDLSTEVVDLVQLITGMGDLLDRSLGPQIELTLDLPQNLPPAKVDANQVELAVLNLAINARDAMPDGGKIAIALDIETVKRKTDLAPGSYLRLRIADTGSGMSAATAKKAIEPFFSTKPVGKGTGLGLSMVHGLAMQLGGKLDLKSKLGKGTTVTLWFPAAETQAAQPEAAAAPAPVQSWSARILLVDDDILIATSTCDMLEDLGHEVTTTHSGPAALEILRTSEAFDLMITDYAMPNMTGAELARAARKLRPDLPILLATGYADVAESATLNLPRLAKPYHQLQLRQEIDNLLADEPSPRRRPKTGPEELSAPH